LAEIPARLRKQLGPEVAAYYSEAKSLYIARIELPMTATGTRRRRELSAKTPDALVTKVRAALVKFREAGDLATSSPTVRTWLTYWLDNIAAKRVRPKTLAGYRSVVNKQIIEAIGQVKLDKLAGVHIRRVHDHVIDNGGSSTYALNAHRVLSKALEDAVREGKLYRNPATLVDAPRKSRTAREALDVGESKLVIKRSFLAFEQPDYDPEPARWATYLLSGGRRGEVIGLEWNRVGLGSLDYSWQLQRLSDIDSVTPDFEYRHIEGGLYWTRPKSSAGWRVIPLVESLEFILEEHRKRVGSNPWGLVFTHNGRPIDPDWETKRWPKALKAMQVTDKNVVVHGIRHSTVDLLYEAGVPEDIIMDIIGHSVRTVTRGYKTRGNQTRHTEAMKQLSALVSGDELSRQLRG